MWTCSCSARTSSVRSAFSCNSLAPEMTVPHSQGNATRQTLPANLNVRGLRPRIRGYRPIIRGLRPTMRGLRPIIRGLRLSWFKAHNSWLKAHNSRLQAHNSWLTVWGLGFQGLRAWGLGFQCLKAWRLGFQGLRSQGLGFRVSRWIQGLQLGFHLKAWGPGEAKRCNGN